MFPEIIELPVQVLELTGESFMLELDEDLVVFPGRTDQTLPVQESLALHSNRQWPSGWHSRQNIFLHTGHLSTPSPP